ncbi:NUDIX hydrolase [Actinokineospora globicatena]|uniref:NUDIX hydrolase n=1 Tax=Actinokineospora globicatena TaxID=103729 RepID=UPI0020A60410|nr:NUDIX hydrolase [Actinokineospora globicatena]MCP2304729.1 NUDIX domain-containing protein [Actinokineospora globicatena]GLW77895.1 NUDIX hydrolase [Actinokineospora globicatena]GLW85438.1 NUDIX hydrolase [Actinokineospora globicatena]
MKWKNHGEEDVYKNDWFKVKLADVELPDGRHLSHFVIRQRPVALTAALNENKEVLLLWRHRFITDTWGWELPAGVVEDDETIEQAAAREMLEETGWRAGPLQKLITMEPANGLSDSLHHVYWADGAEYVGYPEDDFESGRREWVALSRVHDLISKGDVRSANAIAALLLLHDKLIASQK